MATKAEQETILRWDQEVQQVQLYTANPADARRWSRLGYEVEVTGRTVTGEPRGWSATGPPGCVTVRRLVGGQLPARAVRAMTPAQQAAREAFAAQAKASRESRTTLRDGLDNPSGEG